MHPVPGALLLFSPQEVQLASVRDILRLVGELSEEQQRWRKGAAVRAISRVDPEHWHTMHCIVYKDSDEFGLVHLKASLAKLVALATTSRLVVSASDSATAAWDSSVVKEACKRFSFFGISDGAAEASQS